MIESDYIAELSCECDYLATLPWAAVHDINTSNATVGMKVRYIHWGSKKSDPYIHEQALKHIHIFSKIYDPVRTDPFFPLASSATEHTIDCYGINLS